MSNAMRNCKRCEDELDQGYHFAVCQVCTQELTDEARAKARAKMPKMTAETKAELNATLVFLKRLNRALKK